MRIKFGDLANFRYGKMPIKNKLSNNGEYPVYSGYRIVGYYDEFNICENQLIIVVRGVGGTGDVKLTKEKCYLTNLSVSVDLKSDDVNVKYLYYYFLCNNLRYLDTGSAQSQITINDLKNVELNLPDIITQQKTAKILSSLDDKIELNNRINKNLEEQAQAIFDDMFKGINNGDNYVGDIIIPKRGKNLLSKDAVKGDVPVVAGGLEPATYHNQSNTTAPVITISASGANAGYVNLWHKSVWASDSSYIDYTMTENVYFWYVLLKKRQREIYDAQTGSAQPHIYPQHIENLRIGVVDKNDVKNYVKIVAPLFMKIGQNQVQNNVLAQLRDTLLPKLMTGEIDVDNIQGE